MRAASTLRADADSVEIVLVSPAAARGDGWSDWRDPRRVAGARATGARGGGEQWTAAAMRIEIAHAALDDPVRAAVHCSAGSSVRTSVSLGLRTLRARRANIDRADLCHHEPHHAITRIDRGSPRAISAWARDGMHTLVRWPAALDSSGWRARARSILRARCSRRAAMRMRSVVVFPSCAPWIPRRAHRRALGRRHRRRHRARCRRGLRARRRRSARARGRSRAPREHAHARRALSQPCWRSRESTTASDSALAQLRGSGPLVATRALETRSASSGHLATWLLGAALALLLLEPLLRRQRVVGMTAHRAGRVRAAHARRCRRCARRSLGARRGCRLLAITGVIDWLVGRTARRCAALAIPVAIVAALAAAAYTLWRGRRVRSLPAVALWLEERVPALRYALVTALDAPQRECRARARRRRTCNGRRGSPRARPRAPAAAARARRRCNAAVRASRRCPRADLRAARRRRAATPLPVAGGARNRLAPLSAEVAPPAYTGERASRSRSRARSKRSPGGHIVIRGRGASQRHHRHARGRGDRRRSSATPPISGASTSWCPPSPPRSSFAIAATARTVIIAPHADSLPVVTLAAPARDTVVRTPKGALPLAAQRQRRLRARCRLVRVHRELRRGRDVHVQVRRRPSRQRGRRAHREALAARSISTRCSSSPAISCTCAPSRAIATT